MNISEPFIRRPVATTLLTIGVLLAGLFAFLKLPVAPLPQIDFPVILVQAQMAGASPDTMATTVAAPLERRLGAIADVNEMTSTNTLGSTRIVLLFGLNRDIDGAARDVQAAINAARADLPTALRQNPTYRKFNPADTPIIILGMTSDTLTRGQVYDSAATVVQQKLSQLPGVGNVDIGGSSLPAVRVELDPTALFNYGIGLEGIRAALASANANSPKGEIDAGDRRYQLYANDQGRKAADYRDIIVAYRNGAAVKLTDVGQVLDGVEDKRNLGIVNGKPGVLLFVYKQPGANVVETIKAVKEALPQITAALPGGIDIKLTGDRSATIRASLSATEETLLVAVGLVILVVFGFLRSWRATLIPAVAVPISIIGTFSAMYLLGYSLNILSLTALIIGTGFVVDDAIVVLENVQRHIEEGKPRLQAALIGAREVGFTVISMSLSLIAVFLPILLMGGLVGRIFQEFSVTLSLSILISLVLSLTTTPMMCARLLRAEGHGPNGEPPAGRRPNLVIRMLEGGFARLLGAYARTLEVALAHPRLVLLTLLATVGLNVYLYIIVPKGFFPEQDTGQMMGGVQADQRISFQSMEKKLKQAAAIVGADPAVESVVGFTGGRGTNSANVFVGLKPLNERAPISEVMTRLRPKLAQVAGARLYVFPRQDLQMGGRQSFAQYQYTLQGDTPEELFAAAPKLVAALQKDPTFADVTSDQQEGGLESRVVIDRNTAFRYGITPNKIDNTLYDAFGQRQVSTIYNPLNQYHVVMEIAPRYLETPETLKQIYVSTSGGNAAGSATTNAVAGTVATAGGVNTNAATGTSSPGSAASASGASAGSGAVGGATGSTGAAAAVRLREHGRHRLERRRHRVGFRPQRLLQRHRGLEGRRLVERPGLGRQGDDGPALGLRADRARQCAHAGQPPGPVRGDHDLVQPRPGQEPVGRHRRHRPGDGQPAPAGHDPRRVCRRRQELRRLGLPPAAADPGGDPGGLRGAGDPVRELRAPAHDPLHPPLGRRRRGAGPAGDRHRLHHHRADRGVPADRHREEERDHDDRRGDRFGADPGRESRGCDPGGLSPALPADHDDHAGGDARRRAADPGHRRGRGAAPAAGHRHRGRVDREPDPDALHHPRRVSHP